MPELPKKYLCMDDFDLLRTLYATVLSPVLLLHHSHIHGNANIRVSNAGFLQVSPFQPCMSRCTLNYVDSIPSRSWTGPRSRVPGPQGP